MLQAKCSLFCLCSSYVVARVYVHCSTYVGYEVWMDCRLPSPLYRALCIFLSPWQLSAKNICSISIRTNTNVLFNTFAAIVDLSRFNNSCLRLLKIGDDNNE
jgi:hypothetical protein